MRLRSASVFLALSLLLTLLTVLAGSAAGSLTELVSLSAAGAGANGESFAPAISGDGRYVAFRSVAANLIADDTNGFADIFVRDRQLNVTARASVSTAGAESNGGSDAVAINSDGRYVAFTSAATNLATGDSNGVVDVFVRDLTDAVTERVSVSSDEVEANGGSEAVAISGDGRFVAFRSTASNLVSGDGNGLPDIFVRDRLAGTTRRVSISGAGAEANGASDSPAISGNGRFVAFTSAATNLLIGDSNAAADVYLFDQDTNNVERLSVTNAGAQANDASGSPSLSPDARYVAFASLASNLVGGDGNNAADIFLRDRQAGTTERVSLSSTGTAADSASDRPRVSADGRYVAFESGAGNLVAGDTNGTFDVFIRDRVRASIRRASVSSSEAEGNGFSIAPSLTDDGRTVAFQSVARNLVSGDTNGWGDIFVRVAATPPAPPGNLNGQALSQTSIKLTWSDLSDNETGFEIERKLEGGVFELVGTTGANVTTYTDPGLTSNTTYIYHVRATNSGGDSSFSNDATVATLPDVPAVPTDLEVTPLSQSRLELSWSDNSTNELEFKIEKKNAQGTFVPLASVGAGVTTFVDTALAAATEYTYRVRASNDGGSSDYSNVASGTTLPGAPAVPTDLNVAVVSRTELDLAWTDNSGNELGFKIERKVANGAFGPHATVGPNITTFADTNLTANTSYTYRVRSTNAGGDSLPSTEASATTLPNAPAAPSNLTVLPVSTSRLELGWADNSNDESGFKIERSEPSAQDSSFSQIALLSANTVVFVDTGLKPNTTYVYHVRATNAGGDSDWTPDVSGITGGDATNKPTAPANLAAGSPEQTSLTLSWEDKSDNEIGFKLERKTAGGSFAPATTTAANATTFKDTGLNPNTTYTYRVCATNSGGDSDWAPEASGTTLGDTSTPPNKPTGLSVGGATQTSLTLSWNDNSNNETSFKIERKTGSDPFAEVGTAGTNATTYTDNGLAVNTTYVYRVRAANSGGNSDYSNDASGKTAQDSAGAPAAPTGLNVVAISATSVSVTWQDNSDNETEFEIQRKVTGSSFTGVGTVAANVESFVNGGLAPNATYTYRVFASNASGDSGFSNEKAVTLSGGGNGGRLTAAPTALNFQAVKVGQTKSLSTTITNKGTGTLSGTVGSIAAPFKVTAGGGTFVLEPQQSFKLTVEFKPIKKGPVSGQIEITSTDSSSPRVAMKVTGKGAKGR